MLTLQQFYVICKGRGGSLHWRPLHTPAFLIEDKVFGKLVVHETVPEGVENVEMSTTDWVMTEPRSGLVIEVARDRASVIGKGIRRLEAYGVEKFEKLVAKQCKALLKKCGPSPNTFETVEVANA